MMSNLARKTAFSLGLLGSLAAVSLAPAAEAQVRVTGGSIDGNAAFFVPSSSGNISLFDIAIQNMQIVSPNGVLTNPAFVPTATGGFQDADSSNSVTAGDTGLITGKLSGIAFSATGSLIPFSQVDTALAYNVGRFSSTNSLAGTLISAASIPQLFLPITGVTSSDSSVTALEGDMEIGALNANLTAGYIDLPSDVVFRSASQAAVIPFTVPRKIKYEFEGNNVTADSVDTSGTELSFAGEANKKFKIETFGDGRSDSFELSASNGYVDITLGNVNYTSPGTLNTSSPLDYEIKGQTEGILALFGPGQVGVAGTGRNTTFKFQQGSTEVRGNTSGDGTVEFLASAGVNRAGNFNLTSGGTFSSTQLSAYQQAVSSSSFISTRNTTNLSVDRNAVRFGNLVLVFNGSAFTLNGSTSFSTSSSTSLSASESLIRSFLEELDGLESSRGVISIFSGGSEEQFELVAASSFDLKVQSNRNGRVKVKFVQRGGDRIFVALRGDVGVGAFEQVGPGSRMFPGLFGTRQLSAEDAEAVYALIDTLEVSDDEEVDDTETDATDDAESDDSEETSDSDETSDSEVGPAFTGLESLSDEDVDAINSEIESLSTPAEDPAATEPAAEEPAAEEPAAEEPAATEPAAEAPAPEAPVAEAPAPEAPVAEAPAPEAPAADGAALVDSTAPVAE